jgi:hypothetical protein
LFVPDRMLDLDRLYSVGQLDNGFSFITTGSQV